MGEGLEIRLLGELEVVRDGRAISLPASKKTRALLGYLAATARAHLRQTVCELLWPGPDDPRAALRWSLTKIRAVVGERDVERIAADRDRVSFEARGARVDLREVRAQLASPPIELATEVLRALAARFRGELLEGLDLPDAYRFQEWLTAEREAVRAQRVGVLVALVDRLGVDPEAALRFARERVAVDPLAEGGHVAVVRILAQLGRKREALAQFEACAHILATELHTKPSAALLAARMAIQPSQGPPKIEPRAGAVTPPQSPPPPLLGRAREQAAIDAALATGGHVLLFTGEPGIGKSRLLDLLAERGAAAGMRILRARAFEVEKVRPYGVWIDALGSIAPAASEALRADLAPLFPDLGKAEASDRARLFEAVARLLAERAPVAVILDDVQWFDEASAALLHALARAAPVRVVLACAARGEELADNPPALRLVRALGRDDRLVRLDLAPLDEEATLALARAINPAVDAGRVRRESAGNPLFAIEVARALAGTGGEVPASLDGIIADRLARLDEGAREILPWAAALGRTFDVDVLVRVTAAPAPALARALDDLEQRGILRAASEGVAYDFVHDLVRAGAYRQLSAPRRRLVHAQIARALSPLERAGDDGIAGDVARHAGLGGDHALAARAYLTAAERALRIFAHADAARFASAGLDHAAKLPREARVPLELDLRGVQVVSIGLRGARAMVERELSRAIGEAQELGLAAEAATGLHALSVLQNDGGDAAGAWSSTLRAADVVRRADEDARVRQLSDTARCLTMLEREMPRAEAMLAEAGAILGPRAGESVHFAWGKGLLERFRGNASEARTLLARAHALARATGDHWAECESLFERVQLELEAGDSARALALCADVAPVAERMGEGSEVPCARALHALARLAAGEETPDALVDRALAGLAEVDVKGMLAYALNFAAAIDLASGRSAIARARASEALRAAEAVGRRTQVVLAHSVLGRAAIEAGDRTSASAHLAAIRADVAAPLTISARARTAAVNLARELGIDLDS